MHLKKQTVTCKLSNHT